MRPRRRSAGRERTAATSTDPKAAPRRRANAAAARPAAANTHDSISRCAARAATRSGSGQAAPGGANVYSPPHVPAAMAATVAVVTPNETSRLRATIVERRTGRASSRSNNPHSIPPPARWPRRHPVGAMRGPRWDGSSRRSSCPRTRRASAHPARTDPPHRKRDERGQQVERARGLERRGDEHEQNLEAGEDAGDGREHTGAAHD